MVDSRSREHAASSSSSHSQTSPATTTFAAATIGRNGGHVLDAPNLHPSTSKCSQCAPRTWTWGPRPGAARGAQLNVKGSDPQLLATRCNVLRGQHRRVWRGLVTICLDLHSSSNTDESLSPGQVCHMHERVVEGGEDVRDSKDDLSFADRWSQLDLSLDIFSLLGRHRLLCLGSERSSGQRCWTDHLALEP